MAVNKRTQKQIAERFEENLDYYYRPHYWRRLRFWVTWLVTLGSIGVLIWYARESRQSGEFFNPGPLTQAHQTLASDCAACHTKSTLTPRQALAENTIASIDLQCAACHESHGGFLAMHQPNQVGNTSCSACHREHIGPGPMPATTDANCASCHDSKALMTQASQLGVDILPSKFPSFQEPGVVYFPKNRPKEGYTKVFKSFWEGHPEFYFNKPNVKDPNPLRYNHSIHIRSPNVPPVNGRKLDCDYCHEPDRSGQGFLPIKYETNCQSCHALKFDPALPDLNVPHGEPSEVRSFLRGIETGAQLMDYAIIKKGMSKAEATAFATQKILQLGDQLKRQGVASMNGFERLIFFGDGRNRPEMPSCNYCHVVTEPTPNATPQVQQTRQWNQFFQNGRFDHANHRQVKCVDCHDAKAGRLTSEVMMPSVRSCTECHSPPGFSQKSGAPHDCAFCHQYHAPAPLKAGTASSGVKSYLLPR